MQHQIQSYIIGYCAHCGAEARYCDDWDHLEFCEPAPDCDCELSYTIPTKGDDIRYPEKVKRDLQFKRMFHVKQSRFKRGIVCSKTIPKGDK